MSDRDSDLEYTSGSSENGDHDMILNSVLDSDPDYTSDGERASSTGGDDFTDESNSVGEGEEVKDKEEGDDTTKMEMKQEDDNNPAKTGSNDFYFEGVEKLLEVWFTRVDGKMGENCNLRRIPRYQLEQMLKLVHCEIIDSASNDEIDSYVLSESSLFVSQRRLILKTCGTTTPLQCLKFLWTLVKEYTGFDCIEDVYYSHKNYKRPHMQKLPYRKFDNEVQILDEFFHGGRGHHGSSPGGSAYCLGSMNRDCWYLYTYHAPISQQLSKGGMNGGGHRFNSNNLNFHHHHRHLGQLNNHHYLNHGRRHQRGGGGRVAKSGHVSHHHLQQQQQQQQQNLPHFLSQSSMMTLNSAAMMMMVEPDQTLEILMSELDQSVMQIFTQKVCKSAEEATLKSGIHRIIPGMVINDHLFEPCGYSMNGIIKDPVRSKNKNGTYMTIHITPESEFSYVSFETNIAMSSYKEIIARVLDIFKPGKFVLTFFANKASKGYQAHQEMNGMAAIKDQWLRMDNQFCRLEKNDLTYAMYTKFPS